MRHLSFGQRRFAAMGLAAASALLLVALALAGAGEAAFARASAAPVNTSPPSISGSAREGSTLSATPGKWKGRQPITFSGRWLQCNANGGGCFAIPGAQSQEYQPTGADVGHTLRITVTAQNRDGKASSTSKATSVVAVAPASAPTSGTPPTIAGASQEGSILTSSPGQWGGSQPIGFNYQWQRCDRAGNNCASIVGASKPAYTLSSADVGDTVRIRIVAENRAGRTTAYSRPSNVIAAKGPNLPPGAIKLPDGKYSIPITSVSLPDRLLVSGLDFQPNPLRSRAQLITARFRVTDTRGFVVRGALLFVTPLPYGWTTQPPETASGDDGWATVTMQATPRLPRKAAVVMFVRARKAGDTLLAGVSTRRLVQMLVNIQ